MEFPESLRPDFEPVRLLGSGAFGTVFLARDIRLDRPVALKLANLAEKEAELRSRFLREAASLARVQHAHVVRIYDYGAVPEGPYLVMEHLEGDTLAETAASGVGAADPETVLLHMVELSAGLEAIHGEGVVHRDLKPSNVMATRDGRYVLVDFGLVRDPSGTRITRTGEIVGTPMYLSPECLAGSPAGPEADWYAWGAILYELLEGQLPFLDRPLFDRVQARADEIEFRRLDPNGAPARLIRKVLDPDPRVRPASRAEVEEILGSGWLVSGTMAVGKGWEPGGPEAVPTAGSEAPGRATPGPRTPIPGTSSPGRSSSRASGSRTPEGATRRTPASGRHPAVTTETSSGRRPEESRRGRGVPRGVIAAALATGFLVAGIASGVLPGSGRELAAFGEGTGSGPVPAGGGAAAPVVMTGLPPATDELRAAMAPLLAPHKKPDGTRAFRGGLTAKAYRARTVGHFLEPRWPLWMRRLIEVSVAWLGQLAPRTREGRLTPEVEGFLLGEVLPAFLWIGSDGATLTFAHMAPVLGAAQVTAGNLEDLLRKDLTEEGAAAEWQGIEERMVQASVEGREILSRFAWSQGPEPDLALVMRACLSGLVRTQPDVPTLRELLARASRPTATHADWLLVAGLAGLPRGPEEAVLPCELRRGLYAEAWRRFVARGELEVSSEGALQLAILVLKWFQVTQECHRILTPKAEDELSALLDVVGDRLAAFPGEIESGLDWAVQGVVVLQFQVGVPMEWETGERVRRMHREAVGRLSGQR